MTLKKTHTIETAAAKAGFSRATGYRLAAESVPAFPEGGAAGPASAGPSGRHLRDRGGADPGGQSGDPPRGRVPGADGGDIRIWTLASGAPWNGGSTAGAQSTVPSRT